MRGVGSSRIGFYGCIVIQWTFVDRGSSSRDLYLYIHGPGTGALEHELMLLLKFGLSIRLPGHALPVSTRGVWLDDDLLDDLVFRRPTPSVVFQMLLRGPDPSFIAPKKFGCALLLCME